jgi:hypothetical protein
MYCDSNNNNNNNNFNYYLLFVSSLFIIRKSLNFITKIKNIGLLICLMKELYF